MGRVKDESLFQLIHDYLRKYLPEQKCSSDGAENFRYNFIETAIKQIRDWQATTDESISWMIGNFNYSADDLANFQTVANSYGVNLMILDDKQAMFDYINKEGRANDLITKMSFFAHGTAFDVFGTVPNPGYENNYAITLGYSAINDGEHPHNNSLNIFASDIASINSSAFAAGNYTRFGACRTGNEFTGVIFAQEWANQTNGRTMAAYGSNGRTQYNNIYPDDRGFWTKVGVKMGWSNAKASREIAREQYGFSATGSLNYPGLTSGSKWNYYQPK